MKTLQKSGRFDTRGSPVALFVPELRREIQKNRNIEIQKFRNQKIQFFGKSENTSKKRSF